MDNGVGKNESALRNSLSPIFAQSEKLGRKTKKLIRTRLAF
jgi:hypothetical protein